MITYKGADNRSVTRMVSDRRLIDGLKRGDTIEITYTRERAIELTRAIKRQSPGPPPDRAATASRRASAGTIRC